MDDTVSILHSIKAWSDLSIKLMENHSFYSINECIERLKKCVDNIVPADIDDFDLGYKNSDPKLIYFAGISSSRTVKRLSLEQLLSSLAHTITKAYDAYNNKSGYSSGAFLRYTNIIVNNCNSKFIKIDHVPKATASIKNTLKDDLRKYLIHNIEDKIDVLPILSTLKTNIDVLSAVVHDLYADGLTCATGIKHLVADVKEYQTTNVRSRWSDAQYFEFVHTIGEFIGEYNLDQFIFDSTFVEDLAKVAVLKGTDFDFNLYTVAIATKELCLYWDSIMPMAQQHLYMQLLEFKTGVFDTALAQNGFNSLTPLDIELKYKISPFVPKDKHSASSMYMYDLTLKASMYIRHMWPNMNTAQQIGLITIIDEMNNVGNTSDFPLALDIKSLRDDAPDLFTKLLKHQIPNFESFISEVRTYKTLMDTCVLTQEQIAPIYQNITATLISSPMPTL